MSQKCCTCPGEVNQNEKSGPVALFKTTKGEDVVVCYNCLKSLLSKTVDKPAKVTLLHDTPNEIYAHLNRRAVSQDRVKRGIAQAIARHHKVMNDTSIKKTNIFIHGPSGTGKTLISRVAAETLEIPFVEYSATELTPNGYEGDSFTSIFKALVMAAGGDVAKAQKGVVYLDEVDKFTKKYSAERSGLGVTVQAQLLKIIEGTTLNLSQKGTDGQNIMFDTTHVTFILSGACEGLLDGKDEARPVIGIASEEPTPHNKNRQVTTDDLIEYGFLRELIGRMSIVCGTEDLTKDDLIKVLLDVEGSPLDNQRKILAQDDIEIEFSDCFIEAVVTDAMERKTGARGLEVEIERRMEEVHFNPLLYRGKKIVIKADSSITVSEQQKSEKSKEEKRTLTCV
ncbi:AAA family ATPase [Bdellovibrio sp. BCCA]|uniref:AAA family ATPase n=1 Tax=Bdellovibrio sp. BCCA TaxID=3136281 RepID=UPI0030F11487